MTQSIFEKFDPSLVPSPCYVVDEVSLERNLKILHHVAQQSGAKVLLALKAFSMFSCAPLIDRYLSGTCASGLHEARLGREEFSGEVHTFCAAYTESDLCEILQISDHVVFNSFGQWQRFQPQIKAAAEQHPNLKFGLRINPEHSEGSVPLYDPCAPGSRLGIPFAEFDKRAQSGELDEALQGITGLHFHTLCEQDFLPLERTLKVVEEKFGHLLHRMKWVNFGGGHHITREDYQVEQLIEAVKAFSDKYRVQVYIEPGEAIAIHTGALVSEVLDLTYNQLDLAMLDISATCHMPDTLEMPYRPEVIGAGKPGEKAYTYRLGGPTCLAGDVIDEYSFDAPLQLGQRLIFDDMAHYTMVKTSTFNGINLPSIAIWNSNSNEVRVVRRFGYEDFRNRLS